MSPAAALESPPIRVESIMQFRNEASRTLAWIEEHGGDVILMDCRSPGRLFRVCELVEDGSERVQELKAEAARAEQLQREHISSRNHQLQERQRQRRLDEEGTFHD